MTAGDSGSRERSTARLQMRVRRVRGVPVVAARVWLLGGARAETLPGQALVTGRMLSEGSRRRDWRRLATDVEERGMFLQSSGTYETLGVGIEALAEDWQLALEWLAELVFEPAFPADRFAWVRRQAAAELESLLDQPDVRTSRAFTDQLYHPHPYGRALHGDRDSLARLGIDDSVDFHRQSLDRGILVVVTGEIDEAAAAARIEQLFAPLTGTATPRGEVPRPSGGEERRRVQTAGQTDQAHFFAGHLTVPRSHPDRLALEVAAVVLGAGAGLSGRLPERIREREGLAYATDIATTSGAGLDAGRLATYVGTAPANLDKAEVAVREELQRFVEAGMSDEEFAEARAYLVGRDPLLRQTARQWADLLADAELYGLPSDDPRWLSERLGRFARGDVEEAVRRWIRPDELKVTIGSSEG